MAMACRGAGADTLRKVPDTKPIPAALSRAEALCTELGMTREATAAKAVREACYPTKAAGK